MSISELYHLLKHIHHIGCGYSKYMVAEKIRQIVLFQRLTDFRVYCLRNDLCIVCQAAAIKCIIYLLNISLLLFYIHRKTINLSNMPLALSGCAEIVYTVIFLKKSL